MGVLKVLFSIWLALGCFSASADQFFVNFWTWNPGPEYPTYILPGYLREDGVRVLQSYIRKMRASPNLKQEIPLTAWEDMQYHPTLRPQRSNWLGSPNNKVLLLANGLRDHVPTTPRLQRFIPRFAKGGLNSFVLPMGATARFSREERRRIHIELGHLFGTIHPLGGPDVAPDRYEEEPNGAKDFNSERDKYEIELVQDVYYFTNAKLTGPCRAMQLVCVALGCKLIQDIPSLTYINELHRGGDEVGVEHPVIFLPTRNGLSGRLFAGLESWFISDHHQAILLPTDQTIFEIAALSPQGIIEALISRDGRIVLTQAHAELPDSRGAGEIYYSRLIPWMKEGPCGAILVPPKSR